MAFGIIVQLPVSVAFGTDEEFDLRVRLERELSSALAAAGAGMCVGGEIDATHMKFQLETHLSPTTALDVAKTVLTRSGLLSRATVMLETSCEADPDDRDLQVLWPPNHSGVFRVA
jgi:hypothetical protein